MTSIDDCYIRLGKTFESAAKYSSQTLLENPTQEQLRMVMVNIHRTLELEIEAQRKWLKETAPSKS